ncbi:hypothetical protein OHA25_41925 [Nonomuraea sp. NBC_00507]|uniref:hypothetical protein n=1 Tax=Nonomuraea sp. NBC_00507 TaxID=2976002 RepID=UPI002E16D3D8
MTGAHLLFARLVDPQARQGEEWFRVTGPQGQAVGAGYYRDVEALAEVVPLGELRGLDEAGTETAWGRGPASPWGGPR